MDPFTQRMLERARARREKLDNKLSNAGHDIKRRRSPLRNSNTILDQVPDSILKKSPSKTVENHQSPKSKTTRKFSSPKNSGKNIKTNSELNKENGNSDVRSVRSKLQRLGKLYSDNDRELSSPIHRTEEKFAVEDTNSQKSSKSCARLNRLQALATEINNWEDDLSHPTLIKPTVSKAERVQAKFNEQVKSNYDSQPSTSGISKITSGDKSGSPLRPVKWEKSMSETIEKKDKTENKSTCSNSVTSLRSNNSGQILKTPEKSIKNCVSNANSPLHSSTTTSVRSSDSSQNLKTPEKSINNCVSNTGSPVNSARMNSKFSYNCSTKSSLIQSPGSVLNKASIFESKGITTKVKDPAEMTLSERKALFERNKGEALIPKAPLTMSVPTKMLQEKEKSSSHLSTETGKAIEAQRTIFEQVSCAQEIQNVQTERQRELEMLRTRFNRNRDIVQTAVNSGLPTSESSEGKPTSPKNSPVCPVKPTTAPEQPPPQPPPMPNIQKFKNSPIKKQGFDQSSTQKDISSPVKPLTPKKLADVKRVKVSPPKPGQLYPDLTHIESSSTETETEFTPGSTEAETATLDEPTDTETEADYYLQDKYYSKKKNTPGISHESSDYNDDDDEEEDDDDIGNTSLGRSILQVVNKQTVFKKKRSIDPDPDSTTSDISVLDEMDEYLDECLAFQQAGEEGPTPAKLNKGGKSPSAASHSFKYTRGNTYKSPIKIVSPASSPRRVDQYILEGDNCVPLMHSVSLYRKQQSQTPKSPARVISRTPQTTDAVSCNLFDREVTLVEDKIKELLEDVQKQQTIIGQASQALNLCNSTIEFNGSREQVEGERLLLLATHRRQAALNEIQRLKVEGSLRPVVPGAPEVQESGSLTISAITLPFKKDIFRHIDPETCLHFVCLMRHLDTIIATPVVQVEPGDSCLRFPSTLKMPNLFSDFKVTIEVYSLQTRAEILPHEIKYHIHNGGSGCNNSSSNNKKSGTKTPKKYLKQESKLVMPCIQSPAGPSAVQTTSFSLAGYVVFSLKEVHRQQFTLNKVPLSSPLEGRLQMHVSCELTVSVDHHGFLTMFEDISGFGAWHRRWCLLKGATLSYWKYPDDERKKTPIGSLDLQSVTTTNVNLVSRDICARPNTFLLETTRPVQSGDTESLVMVRNGSATTIRHLLSADTKEDRLEWCSKLNKTLHLIRTWEGTPT